MQQKNKNNIIYHNDIEQGSPEWLQFREMQFTGSNADKLLTSFGAGTWSMAGISEFGGNVHTRRGHTLESEAIELYQTINNCIVDHAGFVTNTKYPNCLYSPDGFRPDRTVEVKAFSPKKHMEAIKHPPIKATAQCHFGQLILERCKTDLIFYCPKPRDWDESLNGIWPVPLDKMLVIITIRYDKDVEDNFKRIIRAYHENRRS